MTNDQCEAILKIIWKAREAAAIEARLDSSGNPPETKEECDFLADEAERLNREWLEALADLTGVEWNDLIDSVRFDMALAVMMKAAD